jgi:hypothetical protein
VKSPEGQEPVGTPVSYRSRLIFWIGVASSFLVIAIIALWMRSLSRIDSFACVQATQEWNRELAVTMRDGRMIFTLTSARHEANEYDVPKDFPDDHWQSVSIAYPINGLGIQADKQILVSRLSLCAFDKREDVLAHKFEDARRDSKLLAADRATLHGLQIAMSNDSAFNRLGFATGTRSFSGSTFYDGGSYGHQVWLMVPHGFLVLIFGLPAMWLVYSRVRRRQRYGRGFCGVCGYDLRASSRRCPECGSPITEVTVRENADMK